ncbi:MAG TPA: molybdopterin-dependent oxidoreductase [Jatrophihabitans sp.]|jgi:DMSO/TMAO reductase YedYZ molybdopterin-dependent catalytic subunit|uniref:molybdopterin-dependent oxidoreductase n=1 Tax=Jatrophihabitans sp. TaxID=1932789 RepID=UPI002F223BC9
MTPPLRRLGLDAAVGLLAAGVAIGVGELVAALLRPAASPVIAVGNRFILLTPEPVKRWAIRQFGTADKAVLLGGIYLTLGVLAVLAGWLATRSLRLGLAGVALLGAVGGYCALTANAARASDAVPSVLGALAGMAALAGLVRAVVGTAFEPRAPGALLADRRRFLWGGLAGAGLALLGGFGGRALQHRRYDAAAARAAIRLPEPVSGPGALPSASAQAAGGAAGANNFDLGKSGLPFQTPTARFYRIDTALTVPQLNPDTWRLRISGMVERPLTLSFADLLARPLVERWITLACVSNEVGGDLVGNAAFRGVPLAGLLREAGISPRADQLLAYSSDGMTIGSPTAVVMDGRDAMLALGMNGEPLTPEHGFPVRMVVPGLYGYVSACKWITELRATTFADDQAYWVRGGWAARGPIKLASRIDRPAPPGVLTVGSTTPVAGVAWDQHVGVSRVELQVDDGPWRQARLAPVPSADTWRQWVYLWTPESAGQHRLRVRAFDRDGNPQTEANADPFPSGATGLHTVTVRVR